MLLNKTKTKQLYFLSEFFWFGLFTLLNDISTFIQAFHVFYSPWESKTYQSRLSSVVDKMSSSVNFVQIRYVFSNQQYLRCILRGSNCLVPIIRLDNSGIQCIKMEYLRLAYLNTYLWSLCYSCYEAIAVILVLVLVLIFWLISMCVCVYTYIYIYIYTQNPQIQL